MKEQKAAIGKLTEDSEEHIRKLEKAALERNRRFLKATVPEKVMGYVKAVAIVGLALMSCAWILEHFASALL